MRLSDLLKVALLASLTAVVWLTPARAWEGVCAILAAASVRVVGRPAARLNPRPLSPRRWRFRDPHLVLAVRHS